MLLNLAVAAVSGVNELHDSKEQAFSDRFVSPSKWGK